LPGWTIGALIVLATFVAGAVALTRWIDGQGTRGFFTPSPAPACVQNDCAALERGTLPSELPAPLHPSAQLPTPPRPAEPASLDASIAPEPPLLADAAARTDGLAAFAPVVPIPPVAVRSIASSVAAVAQPMPVDASRPLPVAPQDAAAAAARVEDAGLRGVRCGTAFCPEGLVCCNASCGTCRPPGASCSQVQCGPISPMSQACGPNTCNVGEVCCNASCGICTPPGGTCSQQRCEGVQIPISAHCGPNTCNVGQVCCNASCGICTNPGETCRKEPCQ
jgi:hypothetical protein